MRYVLSMSTVLQRQPVDYARGKVIEGSVSGSVASPARAVTDLNERQAAFLDWYCGGIPKAEALHPLLDANDQERDVPPGDGLRAAIQAGYADSGAANMACRMLLQPRFQEEIERRVKAGRGSMLLAARTAIVGVLEHGTDERAVVAAAVAAFDRFGLAPPRGPAAVVNVAVMNGPAAQGVLADVMRAREERLAKASPALPPPAAHPSGLFDA